MVFVNLSKESRFIHDNRRMQGEPRSLESVECRRMTELMKDNLREGDIITPELAQTLGIKLWRFGNNYLDGRNLQLRDQDFRPLGVVPYPGKTFHIGFREGAEIKRCDVNNIANLVMGRPAKRQDKLYEADVETLVRRGFIPIWAPTLELPLHVRVVDIDHYRAVSDVLQQRNYPVVEKKVGNFDLLELDLDPKNYHSLQDMFEELELPRLCSIQGIENGRLKSFSHSLRKIQ